MRVGRGVIISGFGRCLRSPLLKKIGQVCLCGTHALPHLNKHTLIEFKLIAILHLFRGPPVMITDVVSLFIINHGSLIERMIFKVPILPAL